jgi:arylsulfatase A-like enzyme
MTDRRPNILVVVTDQQRADLVGAAGRLPVETPAADRIASEGTMFTRAYVATPLCVPSRATLLSGQYPSRHGAWTNGVKIPEDTVSLPALLSAGSGYRTAIFGKTHFQQTHDRPEGGLGIEAPPRSYDHEYFRSWTGPYYGFDHAKVCVGHTYGLRSYSMHYGLHLHDNGIPMRAPYFLTYPEADELHGQHGAASIPHTRDPDPRPATWALPEELHTSTWIADETIAFLRGQAGSSQPFYASVNFPDPHPPFAVPAPWSSMYDGVELPPPSRSLGEWEGKPELYRATIEDRVEQSGWTRWFPLAQQMAVVTPTDARTDLERRWWWTYMAMQSLVDRNLGRILGELDVLGLADDTLVVVTSDHGDSMGDHFIWHKGGCHYDGTVRIPLIVRWPGQVQQAARSESLQSLVDLAPTIMSAAGLSPDERMQGVDQLASWRDPGSRCRDAVLIEHRLEWGLRVSSRITDRYRLSIHDDYAHNRQELELYDLQADPGELDSLAKDPGSRDVLEELAAELQRETAETGELLLPRLTAS